MKLGSTGSNRLIQPFMGPYSSPPCPSTLPCGVQTRLMLIGTDPDNEEMVTTDDGGSIPAQDEDFTISRFVLSS